MAAPQEQTSLADLIRLQAQQMSQLLAAVNGLVTLQTAATAAPPDAAASATAAAVTDGAAVPSFQP